MGIIRVLLAIAVVVGHSRIEESIMISGPMAVQSFFIISGFYIAFILNEKYSSYKSFLLNRALKIYPVYFLILGFTIFFSFLKFIIFGTSTFGNWIDIIINLDFFTIIYGAITNILLIGQDFYWVFKDTTLITNRHIFVTQALTLGAEVLFYILSIFLYKYNWKKILFLAILLLGVRYGIIYHFGIESIYAEKFFPAIFIYFVLGLISYKIYNLINTKKISIPNNLGYSFIIILATMTLFYGKMDHIVPGFFYQLLYVIGIPLIFIASKNIKIDRSIAELSYPIYISHILIIGIVEVISGYLGLPGKFFWIYVLISTILVSILIYVYFMIPIEKKRILNVK